VKQNHNSVKGQVLVEFVLISTISVLLILFTIQIALLYNNYLIVNYAAYCGARAGVVHLSVEPHNFQKSDSIAKKAVRTVLMPYSPKESLLTKIEVNVDSKTYIVRITYPAESLIKLFDILPFIPITATSKMVIEGKK
jgi:Flp pilus assembly protein TadG